MRKIIGFILGTVLISGGLVHTAVAWGPIKHMTILEEVIRHPELDPAIRSTLEGNLKYAKGGAVGPDLGNFDLWWNSANASHYCCSGDLARRMLEVARS